jgi:endonuclease G
MVQSFENRVNAMTHDSSPLGGNSGSAIIDVARAEVIALHFAGEYLKANYAVPMYARDPRVASKLNFDGNVTATTDFDPAWRSTNGTSESAGVGTVAGPASAGADLQSPRPPPGQAGPGFSQTATWTIPLSVSVSIGASTLAVGAELSARPNVSAEADLAEEGIVVDQDYSNREGYDPEFLGDVRVAATQIAIVDLEQRTGLDFGDLDKYDHFAKGGPPGTLEVPVAGGRFRVKPVREGADIV